MKNKALTFFLSFIPGVGHYYLGCMQRGLQLNLLFFGTIFLIGLAKLDGLEFLLPVIWFYGLFDALHLADMSARGQAVTDRPLLAWEKIPLHRSLIGWVLIFLGVYSFLIAHYGFFLLKKILPQGLDPDKLLASMILIYTGIYLLFGGRRWRREEAPGKDDAK